MEKWILIVPAFLLMSAAVCIAELENHSEPKANPTHLPRPALNTSSPTVTTKGPQPAKTRLNIEIQIDGKAPADALDRPDLMKEALETKKQIEQALDDPKFSDFLAKNAPFFTKIIVDPARTSFSKPTTINGKHKSLTELKAIIVHEGYAHWVIPDNADAKLINAFKEMFPSLDLSRLKNKFPNPKLAEEIGYRHVGVNAIEILAMRQILNREEFDAYYKPQTKENQNPLRTPVYEEIYNLVGNQDSLRSITEILRNHNVAVPQ